MNKRVTVQYCNDTNSYHCECVFWCNGKVVDRCDESDYDETVNELESMGYYGMPR